MTPLEHLCDCEYHCEFELDLLKRIEVLERAASVSIQVGIDTDLAATRSEARSLDREARLQDMEYTLSDHEKRQVGDSVHPKED